MTFRRIVDYRTTHGGFPTADALQDVSGTGPKTPERLRPLVTVEWEVGDS